jgi:putative Mg2+ transporter-C (MgtC) family protein
MSIDVTWHDILLRIAAAVVAGGLLGLDRGIRGRIAGLRTTILICLAACGAMIEGNLLLSVIGKTASSFAVMDTLRFPLGILSGIGFIGAGAIVRRDSLVTGITTAATLWLVTVVGLILGAGYFSLGGALTVVAFAVLFLLKFLEPLLYREHRGNLMLRLSKSALSDQEIHDLLQKSGLTPVTFAVNRGEERIVRCRLRWYSGNSQGLPPPVVGELAGMAGVDAVSWEPEEAGHLQD